MSSLGNEERKYDLQRWETSRFSPPVSLLKGFKWKKFLFVVSRLVTCNSDVMLLASGQPQLNLLHIIKMISWAPNRQKKVKILCIPGASQMGNYLKHLLLIMFLCLQRIGIHNGIHYMLFIISWALLICKRNY